MPSEAKRVKVAAALLWLSAAALAGVGMAHALRSTDHAATEPVLHGIHGLVDSPRVSVRQLSGEAMGEELQVAALRLGLRWEEQGYQVTIPGDSQGTQHEVLLGTLGAPVEDDPVLEDDAVLEASAWRSLGLRRQGEAWITPDGRAWPSASCVLSVTLAQRHLDGAARRLRLLGLIEPLVSDAALVTVISRTALGTEPRIPTLASPPSSPGVVLWSEGQRVFDAEFDDDGLASERMRSYAKVSVVPSSPAPSNTAAYAALVESANRYSAAIRSLGKKPQASEALGVAELSSIEAVIRDGPLQRSGWYDAASHQLIVFPGLAASADDAVEDFLETEMLRTFGRPASPWFLRGLIYVFTGRAGGFPLTDLESRSQGVTLDDVIAQTRRRTRLALAAVEARLARGVLAEFNSDVASAWTARFEEDEGIARRLRSQWKAGFVKAPVVPATVSPREWSGGVTVEIVSPARGYGQFGSVELHEDFERIASMGFSGVQFAVHVPVVPPALTERSDVLFALRGWGYSVTVEGDGALLVSAAAARAQGLSVVLEPRFVTSVTGGLGHKQIHGSPERIRLYGDRRAVAMEGVAWLAEQAGAAAVVMFDPEELPRGTEGDQPAARQEAEAARAFTRVQSALYAAPFMGERLAFGRSLGAYARAIASGELAPVGPGARTSSGTAPLTSVGLEVALDSAGAPKGRTRRVLLASREAGGELRALRLVGLDPSASPGDEPTWSVLSSLRVDARTGTEAMPYAVLLAPWRMVPERFPSAGSASAASASAPANLREFTDERLRQLAALPR